MRILSRGGCRGSAQSIPYNRVSPTALVLLKELLEEGAYIKAPVHKQINLPEFTLETFYSNDVIHAYRIDFIFAFKQIIYIDTVMTMSLKKKLFQHYYYRQQVTDP